MIKCVCENSKLVSKLDNFDYDKISFIITNRAVEKVNIYQLGDEGSNLLQTIFLSKIVFFYKLII